MSHTLSSHSKRIPELDGLRAFSVISVFLYHMYTFSGRLPATPDWINPTIVRVGMSGVSVFFVISGFIITTLLIKEKASKGQISFKAFYIRRFFRIVPPFFAFLFVLLIIREFGAIALSLKDVACSALFLGDSGFLTDWFTGHTWSLSVEEQFYLVFPPLLFYVCGFRKHATFAVLCVLYVLCVVSPALAKWVSLHIHPHSGLIARLFMFRYIIVGVLLAIHRDMVLPFLNDKSRLWPLLFAVSSLVLQEAKVPYYLEFVSDAVEPCLCGLFVMWFMQNPLKCGLLRIPVVQAIGTASYSIYLWQELFTGPASSYRGWGIELTQIPLAICAVGILSACSSYFIEQPFIRVGRTMSKRIAFPQVLPEGVRDGASGNHS